MGQLFKSQLILFKIDQAAWTRLPGC